MAMRLMLKRVLRKGIEMDVIVPTVSGEDGETDRFILWAGALLHAPHRAVRQQAKTLHSLVYISGLIFHDFC
jgi:pro-apoptotic serine protease NMA111